MKEKSLKTIVILITAAVLGLITVQFYWIKNAIKVEYNNFNKNVGLALSNVVKQIDKNEITNILLKTIFEKNKINPSTKTTIKIITGKKDTTIVNKTDTINGDSVIDVITLNVDNQNNVTLLRKNISKKDSVNNTLVLRINKDSLISKKEKLIQNTLSKLILTRENISIKDRISANKLDSLLKDEFGKYGITTKYNFAVLSGEKDSLFFITDPNIQDELLKTPYKIKLFPDDIHLKLNYLLLMFPDKNGFILKSIWFVLAVSILLTALIITLFYITVKMLIKQKQITEVKNDLLNNITHQFKTPIATISLAADVIAENGVIENERKVKHYSSLIKTESERLTEMVENILTVARFEKNNFELNKKETDIVQIINNVVQQYSLIIKKQNAEIIFITPDQKLIANIDETFIKNALNNLIDNALKYNRNKPQINITVKEENNRLVITIKDNGIGISENHLKNIFETFYRIPTGNIHSTKGNGIGLSITKKIIEAHDGNISVSSKPDKGTIFKIYLPKN
jgi:two-component system phosphate regulon sensor histidine kinase PhoR